jgi:hypothetical protein
MYCIDSSLVIFPVCNPTSVTNRIDLNSSDLYAANFDKDRCTILILRPVIPRIKPSLQKNGIAGKFSNFGKFDFHAVES